MDTNTMKCGGSFSTKMDICIGIFAKSISSQMILCLKIRIRMEIGDYIVGETKLNKKSPDTATLTENEARESLYS